MKTFLIIVMIMALGVFMVARIGSDHQEKSDLFDARIAAYLADDIDQIDTVPTVPTIAIRQMARSRGNPVTLCDETCARLLLSHSAEAVLVDVSGAASSEIDVSAIVQRISFENRPDCEASDLSRNKLSEITLRLANIAAANGRCLVAREAQLDDADVVVTVYTVNHGTRPYDARFDTEVDPIHVRRTSISFRRNGVFEEVYRRTFIEAYPLRYPLRPKIYFGSNDSTVFVPRLGYARRQELHNLVPGDLGSTRRPDQIRQLVSGPLGMDLSLDENALLAEYRSVVTRALTDIASMTANDHKILNDYMRYFSFDTPPQTEDLSIIQKIFGNYDLDLPNAASNHNLTSARVSDPIFFDALAEHSFARLRLVASDNDLQRHIGLTQMLGGIINRLPEEALITRRADFQWLLQHPELRYNTGWALAQLSIFGEDSAGIFLSIIAEYKDAPPGNRQRNYELVKLGLSGLCRMGAEASATRSTIIQMIQQSGIPMPSRDHALLINTLVSIGASDAEINDDINWPNINDDPERVRRAISNGIRRAREEPYCG